MQDIQSFGMTRSGRAFVKMHGLLNHFVIVDARLDAYRPPDDEIIRICDPRAGVGGDQLVVIEPSTRPGADAFMRLYNVDGREVEACGNATRCVAWLLMEEADKNTVVIETLAGLLSCVRCGPEMVSCEMGSVSLDWRAVPLAEQRDTCHVPFPVAPLDDGVALSIGNPHVVFFVSDLDAVDVRRLAPAVQQDPIFPNQANVGVAEMTGETSMRLVVYERGAGLTTACGSGACVAVYAALARGLTDARRVTVSMPAGEVEISISANGEATMTGPVAWCFSGILDDAAGTRR